MPKLDLSLFKVEQAIMQITYPISYFLWDNSGKIWEKVKTKYPSLKEKDAPQPDRTSFFIDKDNFFSVSIDKLIVNSQFPKESLKEFIEKCNFLYKTCLEELKFQLIERLGVRLIYSKEFSSSKDLSKSLLDLSIINFPSKKLFNIDGNFEYGDVKFKWEGDSLGSAIVLKTEKRNLILDPPPGWGLDEFKKEKLVFVYDVDYYSIGNIKISQLELTTWLDLAIRQIKRESETLFKTK